MPSERVKEAKRKVGSMDKSMHRKLRGQSIRCPCGKYNSPNAVICWGCGEKIKRGQYDMSSRTYRGVK